MSQIYFHLGPVQGFVAQARRTRDLWAGSFLVAYLSGTAMAEVRKHGGKIEKPFVGEGDELDLLMAALEGRPSSGREAASLPNHFTATIEGNDDRGAELAALAAEAVRAAWCKIAGAVYEKFVAPVEGLGNETRAIFDRQISSTWEVYWVVGSSHAQLAGRKRMRLASRPVERGDKCTLAGDLEELSGHGRSGKRTRESSRAQGEFWRALVANLGKQSLDLHPKERLSAPVLVKRLFVKVSQEAVGWPLGSTHWPSTAYLAATPFIDEVLSDPKRTADAAHYAEQVLDVAPDSRAPKTAIRFHHQSGTSSFEKLDGNFYFPKAVADENRTPLSSDEQSLTRRESLVGELAKLSADISPPCPHFALLLADGDRLGRLISEAKAKGRSIEEISRALGNFTRRAREVVSAHRGVTVYAGGDDVMAMLSAEDGLAAADALEVAWQEVMGEFGEGASRPSLSAALILAHYRTPLRPLVSAAHHLLDEVAKDSNGRDSVAISLWKGNGEDARWVTTWRRQDGTGEGRALAQLLALSSQVKAGAGAGGLSTSFLHRLEQLLALLAGRSGWSPGERVRIDHGGPDALELEPLIAAEYAHSKSVSGSTEDLEQIRATASALHGLMRPHRGHEGSLVPSTTELEVDAPILARFLAILPQEQE